MTICQHFVQLFVAASAWPIHLLCTVYWQPLFSIKFLDYTVEGQWVCYNKNKHSCPSLHQNRMSFKGSPCFTYVRRRGTVLWNSICPTLD